TRCWWRRARLPTPTPTSPARSSNPWPRGPPSESATPSEKAAQTTSCMRFLNRPVVVLVALALVASWFYLGHSRLGRDGQKMILIPGGPFVMGREPAAVHLESGKDNEHPAHRVDVPAFYIDATLVSNSE